MLLPMFLSDHAIHRRAKKFLVRKTLELFVPVLPGFEKIAESELQGLGYEPVRTYGGVAVRGDMASIYRINLALRSGNRVLLRLKEFLAQNYPMLYNRARTVPWEAILGKCPNVDLSVSTFGSRLKHKRHVKQVVCDAIADRMAEYGLEPDFATDANLTVMVRLSRDRCTLSLDTTGPHLHKRGYRFLAGPAPIRESTAAGILLAANSKSYEVLVDPFCGAGTLLVEAELIARNEPPGSHRSFAIEWSPLHSSGLLKHQLRLLQASTTPCHQRILGFDISKDAVQYADAAASNAGASHISLRVEDATHLDFRALGAQSTRRLIAANLPYGRRLGSFDSVRALVARFSDAVARTADGWHYAFVLPATISLENPALVTTQAVPFSNGGLPVVALLGYVRA